MYGTVARLKVKPGMEAEMVAYGESLKTGRATQIKGIIGGYVYQLDNDPRTVILTVVFEDKASYHANAQDPAQDEEYQRLRALLTEGPIWEDGEIIAAFSGAIMGV